MAFWKRLRGFFGGEPPEPSDEAPAGEPAESAASPAEGALTSLRDPSAPAEVAEIASAVESLRAQGAELRAIELLGDAVRLRPDEPVIVSALAEAHVSRLDLEAAAPLLERLLSFDGYTQRAELLLGERAEEAGRFDEALAHYERVLAKDLAHGQARARAERLRRRLGRGREGAQPTIVQPEGVSTRGRYRLERELGRGGAGAVYLAVDSHLDRQVALKVYHPQVMRRDGARQLAREAALPGRIGHPGIVHVFDVDSSIGALSMELLPGGSIKALLRHEGPLSAARALRLVEAICDPLSAVHDAGIVHRDMKPANVLLREDGAPVLTDMGVALLPGEPHEPGVGTPAYMAPEQHSEGRLDARADVYAVGVMLAEMLGGYPGPPGLVGDLLDRCLCESPGGRPRDAAELARLARSVRAAEEAPQEFKDDLQRVAALAGEGS